MAIKRNPIKDNPGSLQIARTSGEFLRFTLTVEGPAPIFSFNSSVKGVLFEARDFMDHATDKYEWEHLKNPSDAQAFELLDLHIAFLANKEYRYKVERCAGDGSVIAVVMEIDFSGDPTDHTAESFLLMVS
jgi:hypothetical protein